MKLSLIVLNYNDFTTTENFIKKIKNYKNIENIIVVDNASTDGSYEKLKKYEGTNIAIIKTERNKGYASGNNFGIKYAIENFNPEYLCISNPDIDIEDEVFKNITDFMEKTDKAGIVSGIIYKDEKTENISAWHLPTYKNCILEQLYVLHTLLRKGISYSNDELRKKLVHEVDVIPGCFFVIKTEVMKDIGYFDERTFLYYEENILSKKLHDKNYHNYILSNIKFYHREHVSIEKIYLNGFGEQISLLKVDIYIARNI